MRRGFKHISILWMENEHSHLSRLLVAATHDSVYLRHEIAIRLSLNVHTRMWDGQQKHRSLELRANLMSSHDNFQRISHGTAQYSSYTFSQTYPIDCFTIFHRSKQRIPWKMAAMVDGVAFFIAHIVVSPSTAVRCERERDDEYRSTRVARAHRSDWCRTYSKHSMHDESVPSRRFSFNIRYFGVWYGFSAILWAKRLERSSDTFFACLLTFSGVQRRRDEEANWQLFGHIFVNISNIVDNKFMWICPLFVLKKKVFKVEIYQKREWEKEKSNKQHQTNKIVKLDILNGIKAHGLFSEWKEKWWKHKEIGFFLSAVFSVVSEM